MAEPDLVDKSLVTAWARWSMVWLTLFPLVGILVSIQFHNPEFLGGISWFTFGRLRAVHMKGVLFGSFTTAFIALLYYFAPRLCGTPLYKAEWGWWLLWLWNGFLILGSLTLLLGYTSGVEYAEFAWPINIMRYLVVGGIDVQVSERSCAGGRRVFMCRCGMHWPHRCGHCSICHRADSAPLWTPRRRQQRWRCMAVHP